MKKLFLLLINILIEFVVSAQANDTLGWSGTPIIPLSSYVNLNSWHTNASAGDNCYVSKDINDITSLCLHWKFNPGTGHKYAQIYFVFNSPVSLSDKDIFGIDIKGQKVNDNCSHILDVQLKFESLISSYNATFSWHNMARIERWCENISALKKQFQENSIDWNNIKVVSLEVNSDSDFSSADSGTVFLRGLRCDRISGWERTKAFSSLTNSSSVLEIIKKSALDTILKRQSPVGLFCTWREDGSSWLYGQGLVLKILSTEGWNTLNPDSVIYQNAARKLATFLVNNQNPLGYWPREWRSATGQTLVDLESDGSVWLGDFPWAITGLANYYRHTNDASVINSINKARRFLTDSLIDSNGKLYTLQKTAQNKYIKQAVTSVEAYSAVILGFLELNDTIRAVSLARYIDSATWDISLKYWNESIGNKRPVLFANTWFSQLIRNNKCISDAVDPTFSKSKAALSFVSRVLYTRGPGNPAGFDGIGPVATWFEGTFSFISAGGPGSQSVFDSIADFISPGYAVPHYNDEILCNIGGVWAEKWISLDGTSWLWFSASNISPFGVTNDPTLKIFDKKKEYKESDLVFYPNPVNNKLFIEIPETGVTGIFYLYNMTGRLLLSQKVYSGKTEFDVSNLKTGVYFGRVLKGNNTMNFRVIKE